MNLAPDLERIQAALDAAQEALRDFTPGAIASARKAGGDPVTEADHAVNAVLERLLPRPGEGWLSEETRDDARRLGCRRTWVVDPIDGTREFVAGIPEWCVSVGLVVEGRAVAGGVLGSAAQERVLGAQGRGTWCNGRPARVREHRCLDGLEVLASRSEVGRGEWRRFEAEVFTIRPMGSVAYKLARVAAGLADLTWTLVPKNEWDVAAGAALVNAAGGTVLMPDGREPRFNQPHTRLAGVVAAHPALLDALRARGILAARFAGPG